MKFFKQFSALTTLSVLFVALLAQGQLDQNSRKKGPPFNDEGPGGSGKRVEWVQGQL